MVPTIPTISSPLRSSIIYDHGTIFLAFLITNLLLTNLESSLCVVIMSRTSIRVNPHSIVYLNVKELLARSRRHIWSLSDSNVIQTHKHLVCKRTLNHLAKLAKWLSSFHVNFFNCHINHIYIMILIAFFVLLYSFNISFTKKSMMANT